jgi:hypothetical protein
MNGSKTSPVFQVLVTTTPGTPAPALRAVQRLLGALSRGYGLQAVRVEQLPLADGEIENKVDDVEIE